MMRSTTRSWVQLVISVVWVFLATALLLAFNQHLLMSFPIGIRMVLMIVNYWFLAAVPLIFAIRGHYRPFQTQHLGPQLLVGLGIGVVMSCVLTFVPHLLGLGHLVGNDIVYSHLWQFAYDLLYFIVAVALVEEFIFRGFIFHNLQELFHREWIAVLLSSVLFGLFHFGSGDVLYIMITCLMGVIWCLCRTKLRNCTLLSLVIAHGVYDWMVRVWAWVFS